MENTVSNSVTKVQLVTDGSEIKNQVIIAGIGLLAAVGVVWIQRKLSGPDVFVTLKMRCLAGVQEYADTRARFWHDVSAVASKAYLDSRG